MTSHFLQIPHRASEALSASKALQHPYLPSDEGQNPCASSQSKVGLWLGCFGYFVALTITLLDGKLGCCRDLLAS